MRLVVLPLLLLPTAAFAQAAVSVDREVYGAVDGMSSDYKEHFPAGSTGHDREHGWTPGFGVGSRWMGNVFGVPDVYTSLDFHYQRGNVAYVGSDFLTGAPVRQSSGLTTIDVTGEIGRGFLLSPRLVVIPLLQIGYHRWERGLTQTQDEDYDHVFFGAGVRANYTISPSLVGTLRLGVAGMIDPRIDVRDQGSTDLPLGGAPVYQAGGKLDYALTRRIHVFTAADLTHFDYRRSPDSATDAAGQLIFEPSSTTTNIVVSGGVAYGF